MYSSSFAMFLINAETDRFRHNEVIADELVAAFDTLGLRSEVADYIIEPRRVREALRNPECLFLICFNGFGSEIRIAAPMELNRLESVFDFFGKPLYDIMHDCPAHDWMAHQSDSIFAFRRMLLTDYGYASIAAELGANAPRFVPSITYPRHVAGMPKPLARREIPILLPVGLSAPSVFSNRFNPSFALGGQIRRMIFEEASERALADWRRDANVEVISACRRAGVSFQLDREFDQYLVTCTVDYVKFERRRRLFRAIRHLPITIVTDQEVTDVKPDSSVTFLHNLSWAELLRTMGEARIVICPTPHMNGFHERFMGAFTAGAAVVSSPNAVLDLFFTNGRDFFTFRDEADLAERLTALLDDLPGLQSIADSGRERALQQFPPQRLAEIILSIDAAERANPIAPGAPKTNA